MIYKICIIYCCLCGSLKIYGVIGRVSRRVLLTQRGLEGAGSHTPIGLGAESHGKIHTVQL